MLFTGRTSILEVQNVPKHRVNMGAVALEDYELQVIREMIYRSNITQS